MTPHQLIFLASVVLALLLSIAFCSGCGAVGSIEFKPDGSIEGGVTVPIQINAGK